MRTGISFSWKRLLGISSARAAIARATGIPTTKSGLQRKVGRRVLRLLGIVLAVLVVIPVSAQASDSGRVNVGHKVGHFAVGFGVAWGCGLTNHHKTGLAIGIGLGLAKEYSDNKGGETWASQKRDIIITSAGAFLGYAIAKHYYPDGADLGRRPISSQWQQQQEDIRLQAEFKAWEVNHG